MWAMILALAFAAGTDEPSAPPNRTEQWLEARQQKALKLESPKRSFFEKGLYEFKERRVMERYQEGLYGFHPMLGAMHTGSGFAGGARFEKGRLQTSAQISTKGYQKYAVQLAVPKIASERIFADFQATYRNYPQEDFFGIGQTSKAENRTNYRLEDANYTGRAGFKLKKGLVAGVHAGWLDSHVGTGTDSRFPSTELLFTNDQAPAIRNQPDYLQAGAFLEFDYRDAPNNPRAGGRYTARWTSFQDRKLGPYDFSQYDIEVQQYLPFFNQRRVFALRGKATLTGNAEGQEIPFYMQPTLGGSDDLRGYDEYRFRDRNMVVFNAEYRWEAFSGLDLALFADAGQVAGRAGDINLSDLKTSGGVGFRFNTAKGVFWRIDVATSSEGQRVFFKFGHFF